VRRRRARGYSLMEVIVAMALFGVFLFIIVTLTAEMRRNEKKWPVNFFARPEIGSIVARIRHDVLDATSFPDNIDTYSQSPTSLIVYTIDPDRSSGETVVWDFSKAGEVHRKVYKANHLTTEWVAREAPIFVCTLPPPPQPDSGDEQQVHIQALDKEGKVAIDQIFIPRPHS